MRHTSWHPHSAIAWPALAPLLESFPLPLQAATNICVRPQQGLTGPPTSSQGIIWRNLWENSEGASTRREKLNLVCYRPLECRGCPGIPRHPLLQLLISTSLETPCVAAGHVTGHGGAQKALPAASGSPEKMRAKQAERLMMCKMTTLVHDCHAWHFPGAQCRMDSRGVTS